MSTLNSLSYPCFISAAVWQRLAEHLKLSQRELQIVQCIVKGEKEILIARHLRMSRHTVHTHMERLYAKLAVQSRVELVVAIFTHFLAMTADMDSRLPPICGRAAAGQCPLLN